MLELSSVVLAIVEGASSALTSHLLRRRNEPVDIRVLVEEAVEELKAQDRELAASVAETTQALQSLKAALDGIPELDIQEDYNVIYQPSEDSDLGDVLYRLDEEIEALRRPNTHDVKIGVSGAIIESSITGSVTNDQSILEGLDEEIASLRVATSGSSRLDERMDA